MAAARDGAARLGLFLDRRRHPDFPPPDEAALFGATRAVLGAIRAAVQEDSPLVGTPAFEDALVRMVLGLTATAGPR